ncbi:MAG: hypothetical protein E7172_03280 [Firmicutes bacterium]|nr:hypothetical protein [Bacillota bacterium]
MKKNRNSFFSEANMSYSGYNPNMNMMPNNGFQTQSYNSYYAGPNMMPNTNMNNEIESRLAKIERQINRLDHRLNKLENNNAYITDDIDNNTSNMYML